MNLKVLKEYEEGKDKVFVLRDIVEIRIPRKKYEELLKKFSKEHIVSFSEDKRVVNRITRRELVFVTRESGIPLIGHSAFGIIDRGTNLLQVRCMTGCNLNCIFCSVDEGKESKTRKTDFIVDPDYMIEVLRKFVEFKGDNVEVHLDGQGEPALYPYLTYFVEKLKDLKVETVSMQTNGTVLSEKIIDKLEGNMTRINLSISALSEEKAKILHGKNYPLKHVLNIAETIANSKIDLLIAPVWVPDYNDDEIPKIIEFALEIGAGKKFPPLGIQKYIPYRFGRKLKKSMSFKEFYEKLSKLEKEYGIKLILRPEDFNMEKRPKYPNPFKKGDIERGKIVSEGRMVGEKLVVARGRSVAVYTKKKVGEFVEFEVVSAKDNIIVGVEK
ncbi:MAG: radical SAM protein [Archaeoglobaceae archaeon]|nr:radical SAM protein [Archaeoglobaceae archaeon]MCX8151795.1 radical SAM protein [Archaeoglobaceae archaeon]MDW8013179.1 radical SAM protein [Archaeoglobaceae archaeon]